MSQENMQQEESLVNRIVKATLETERKLRRQQVLHNTRMLMERYIDMQQHIDTAASEEDELDADVREQFGGTGAYLESVRRSKVKTALMLENIDRAMEELRKECEGDGTGYKYEAFRCHYIEGKSYEEIAEAQNCGKNTPARWSKELIRRMSIKLFGVDGVEKY